MTSETAPPEWLATLRKLLALSKDNRELEAGVEAFAIAVHKHALGVGCEIGYAEGMRQGHIRGRRKGRGLPEIAKRPGRPIGVVTIKAMLDAIANNPEALPGLLERKTPLKRPVEYSTLASMKSRCYNRNNHGCRGYGGRGISVCDRWREGEDGKSAFECFLEDMGPRPSPKHSIDRINGYGNYEPENCRWATVREQAGNRSRPNY